MAGIIRHIPLGMYKNNVPTSSNCRRENHGVQTPASKHCRLLEEFIKRQNLELAQKQRVHEEMRALIDWLKKDLSKAEGRVRELEEERAKINEETDSDTEDDVIRRNMEIRRGRNQEKALEKSIKKQETYLEEKKLESLQEKLSDRNEKIDSLQETLDEYEREIDDLQKENESYIEQIRRLQTTIQRQERELEIDREVEEEREDRLKDLVAENEALHSQVSRLKHQQNHDF